MEYHVAAYGHKTYTSMATPTLSLLDESDNIITRLKASEIVGMVARSNYATILLLNSGLSLNITPSVKLRQPVRDDDERATQFVDELRQTIGGFF